jgi:putative transposase
LVRQEAIYQTIDEFKGKNGATIELLCKILGIPRSSYYKHLKRSIPTKETQDEIVSALIMEYNVTFNGILGYRRMTLFINNLNHTKYSVNYIHRLMRKDHITSRIRRKRYNYVASKPEQTGQNILHREFTALCKNQKWLTDVTEFKISGVKKKLYLSSILDLYGKEIIAYKISPHNNNKLVFDTFDEAVKKYPDAKPIFHSDRGFQYTSKVFKIKLDNAGMIQSMSRVGKCIDNGPMEAFWGTLKSEMFYGMKFDSLEQLEKTIIKYILFYNNQRYQAELKGMTPIEFGNHANGNLTPMIV